MINLGPESKACLFFLHSGEVVSFFPSFSLYLLFLGGEKNNFLSFFLGYGIGFIGWL